MALSSEGVGVTGVERVNKFVDDTVAGLRFWVLPNSGTHFTSNAARNLSQYGLSVNETSSIYHLKAGPSRFLEK